MEVRAVARHLRFSPFKGRLVADMIRGRDVNEALGLLTFTPKKAARALKKVLHSAVSNALQMEGVNIDDLVVKTIFVDEGPRMKRIMMRSMGRANRIVKRSCHVTIVLDEK